jgi:hypothetical protein
MNPQLLAIIGQLESARSHLLAIADRTPAERWGLRADPNRWSVGECVAHLNLTSQAYIPVIRTALNHPSMGPATGRRYRRDFIGLMLGYAVGPLPPILRRALRFKTAATFVPHGNAPKEETVTLFDDLQTELVQLTRECDGRAIDKVLVRSPFDQRASYNLYSALTVIPRHEERHLIQADEIWAGGTA